MTPIPSFATRPVLAVAGALAAVELTLAGRYGFHRDELYFVVAGDHLAWGYVDQPPLTPLLARLSSEVFGDSLVALRVLPALMAAAIVVITALVSRELGAGRSAQILAAVAAAVSGLVLVVGHMLTTAGADLLAWMLLIWLALRLFRTRDDRLWVPIGLVVGVAVLNKYLVVLLLIGLLVGLLVHGPRSVLRSPRLAVGVVLAAVVVSPNLWWQATHDWPQLTVAGGISEDDGLENRLMFVPLQLLQLSPLLVPFAIAGAIAAWRTVWARPLVTAYVVIAAVVLVTGGKPYYALPPVLAFVAAGCQPVLDRVRAGHRRSVWVTVALAAVTSAFFTLPVVPIDRLGIANAVNQEQGEQVGWPELTDQVAEAWARIPASQRGDAVIFTTNYGEAGALRKYGAARGLPAAHSGHMSFWDWGPPPESATGPVLLVHVPEAAVVEDYFVGCEKVGKIDNGHDLENDEQGALLVLCAGPRESWSEVWPELRHFY